MAVALLHHGIAQGGTVGTTPCYAQVVIDTTGADFLFVGCTGGAAHPYGDVFTDSQSNMWIEMPGYPSAGSGYSGNTCQSRYFYCVAPSTSATHSFRMTTVNCGQLSASIAASAWSGIDQATPFNVQKWGGGASSPLTTTLTVTTAGFAISPFIIGYGDGNTGSNEGTTPSGWTLLDRAPSVESGTEHFVGLNLAYKTTTIGMLTSAWTYDDMAVVSGTGAGIFAFIAAAGPPPATTTSVIRRQRICLLPSEGNKQMFLERLELLIQPGMGLSTGLGSDPIIMVELSRDDGFTWGPERQLHGGKIGEYFKRVYAYNWGRGRQLVVKITQTDPVFCAWLDLIVDLTVGTN